MRTHHASTAARGRSFSDRSRAVRVGALVGCFAALALIVGGCLQVRVDTGIDSFLPAGDQVSKDLQAKAEQFGGDPLIVLLETAQPRALYTDPTQLLDLIGLEGRLAASNDVAAVYGPGTVLNQTAGAAQNMLAQIAGRGDGFKQTAMAEVRARGGSPAQVAAAGARAEAIFNQRYGPLMVEGLPAGLPTVRNPQFVQTVLFTDAGLPRPQWHFVVVSPTVSSILIRPRAGLDQAGASRLTAAVRAAVAGSGLRLSRTTITGTPSLTAALSDRARHELPLLGGISVLAVCLVFGLMNWTSRRRSRLRPTLAALVGTAAALACFGWAGHQVSLGVVAFLPILLGIGSDFPLYLMRGGRDRHILVAALAAAVGFASLAVSPLPFVRELGVALALGVVLTVAVALVLRWFLGSVPVSSAEQAAGVAGPPQVSSVPPVGVRALVGLIAVGVGALGWVLLPGLTIQAQPEKLAAGLPELGAVQYAESLLDSSGEVNIVLKGTDVARADVLRWSRAVEATLVTEHGDTLHPVLSMGDLFRFLGADPTPDQITAATAIVPHYLTSAVMRTDGTEGLIVLGVQFDDVHQLAGLLQDIKRATANPPTGISVSVVGLPVAAVRGLDLVSRGRLLMNLLGIAAAGLVLLIGLPRRRDAIRAVLTVALATGWVVVLAALTTDTLSPLTVAVGSLTTATGCEFAVMLGSSARSRSLRAVGTAALAGTAGYLVLGLSELSVLRDFGSLLAAGVGCSFGAALLVTRVLLPERPPTAATVPAIPLVAVSPPGSAPMTRMEVLL